MRNKKINCDHEIAGLEDGIHKLREEQIRLSCEINELERKKEKRKDELLERYLLLTGLAFHKLLQDNPSEDKHVFLNMVLNRYITEKSDREFLGLPYNEK